MTDETMSVPITGAEFDDAMAAALNEAEEGDRDEHDEGINDGDDLFLYDGSSEESEHDLEGSSIYDDLDGTGDEDEHGSEYGMLEGLDWDGYDDEDSDEDVTDFDPDDELNLGEDEYEDGIDDESSDDYDHDESEFELSQNVADVADMIIDGDTDGALRRLGEYGRGVEKLQAQRAEAQQNVDNLRTLLAEVSHGDSTAIQVLDHVLASHGTSIEAVFAAKMGIQPPMIADNGYHQPTAEDYRLAQLEAQMRSLSQERADADWINQYGLRIADYVEQQTGLRLDPKAIARVRYDLPSNATVEDIEEAVMRADPRAYRRALAQRSGLPTAPSKALVSRGGKGSAKADAKALLNDPRKFEAYMKG